MKIVVTNDDGFDQPGLAALCEAVATLGQVTVVAPATPQSNVGHQVTMNAPIRVDHPARRIFVIHATPADCTRLAIKKLAPDTAWIIAGINPGANLGSDVYQSGTVAAAREAAILGVRAMAVSQYIAPRWTIDWPKVQAQVAHLIPRLMAEPLPSGNFWNVNLPSPIRSARQLAYRYSPLDKHPHHYHYDEHNGTYRYCGTIHDRPRTAGSDVDTCFGGMISVTRMEI